MRILIPLIFISLSFGSCRKDPIIEPIFPPEPVDTTDSYFPTLPGTPFDYENEDYAPHILNDPNLAHLFDLVDKNQITDEGATLGRVLFYDKNLSANNTISCGSCHHQDKAFADGLAFSPGFEGGLTGRNSMPIVNAQLNNSLFWDGRATNAVHQSLMPIQDAVEMGMELPLLENKLSQIDYYKPLFEAAFGDTTITSLKISLALGQFVSSIKSYRSKYDQGFATNFSNFTAEELLGKDVFFDGEFTCFQCHFSENFGGLTTDVTGLDSISVDMGAYNVTGDLADVGAFRSVSLRNIELTGPYMHDGRFETLEEVVDFYATGKKQHANLDFRLTSDYVTGGHPLFFDFSNEEKDALIAFMKTLTDWDMVADPKFSDPFPE
ncbi:MAG: hypothetical protein BM555_05985 [Crocinitomix sp. MedPE-SWsnd]|nr:MAG: hypothetical protein BM555_05985 [Crocinitomix sp. MedPE-SWsnd]